ncbi:MAG: Fur family transcriptional regulator, partial [Armatimonadota bacterium]
MRHTDPDMPISEEELKRRVDHCHKVLKQAGVRTTHQRLVIFEEVARSSRHPDADAVYRAVRRRIPTISLDTVYRTLWLFKDLGLVATLGPSRERTRFDGNVRRHHHFICNRCGTAI